MERFCVYVDWFAPRNDDLIREIGFDVIPDDEETCIYWDEKRPAVLVLSWNLEASDVLEARRIATETVVEGVGKVIPGSLGAVTVSPLDDDE